MFTFLDLSQSFFHIPICDVLKNLFYFESSGRRYKYAQLPQGCASNATAFHSKMKALLAATRAVVYVDDVLIEGRNQWEHDKQVRIVMDKLALAGMHVNAKKI